MTTPALAENVKGKGRHYRHPVTGDLVPSVTNVLGILAKPALPRWAAKEVAEKAWQLRRSLDAMGEEDAISVLKQSPWRKSGRAAERGTTIHAYLEARINGLEPEIVDGEAKRYQAGAEAWLEQWNPEPIATELTVFAPDYAGTGDLWCTVAGEPRLVDFKTSKAVYPEAAVQLGALAAATLDAGGKATPVVANGWVVRIGEDGFECRQVDDLAAQADVFRAMLQVWHWTNTKPYRED